MSYVGTICPQCDEDCKYVDDLNIIRDPPTAEDGINNMEDTILDEAKAAVYGARNESYGHPRDNFKQIADLWSSYKGVEFDAEDVALMMVLVKVARLKNGYHRDSVVDIAGYAATYERLHEPDPELQALLDTLNEALSPFDPDRRPWPRLGTEEYAEDYLKERG